MGVATSMDVVVNLDWGDCGYVVGIVPFCAVRHFLASIRPAEEVITYGNFRWYARGIFVTSNRGEGLTMTGPQFEREVRSIARALWNLPPGEGAAENVNNDEIDCICRTEDLVHLIECTTERTMGKFRTQTNKLGSAKQYLERNGNTVKLWIVTANDPTAEQRSNARGLGITALSIQEFQRRLLDSRQYIEARWLYRFGSASDPDSGSHQLDEDEYVEQPLTHLASGTGYRVSDICELLHDGRTIVLIGPFGAGKSLTVREIFRNIRQQYHRNQTDLTPIAINLRDHWGQSQIEEILHRHATKVGFSQPHQLVRAWNAGRVIPLLDGIDELASPVMAMGIDAIRRSREEALKVIQAFMQDVRGRTGVLLTGRDHYFDSTEEARRLMRLPNDTIFVDVGEFSEEQASQYLRRKKVSTNLPTWLPRKPLLLGYLASHDLLDQVVAMPGDGGSALAWDHFLNRICEREADLSSDIESGAIRQLLEDLATRARSLPSGSGPLYDSDLSNAYKAITGYEPLEAARTMLQRLPGLTARDQEVGARSFVDDEMMEALRAGAVARFIIDPYRAPSANGLAHPLNAFGCSMAGHLATELGTLTAQYSVAAEQAVQRWGEPTLALDALLAGSSAPTITSIDGRGLTITGGLADTIDMEDHPITNLVLDSCLLNSVHFDSDVSDIRFQTCAIIKVEGVADRNALPSTFVNCEVQEFDNLRTNNAIAGSELPTPVKMLLIIIRKLFLQRGSGRAESALYRGIDGQLQPYVRPVLELLVSQGIVYSHSANRQTIWHGNRPHRTRMLKILEAPVTSDDTLIKTVSAIDVS